MPTRETHRRKLDRAIRDFKDLDAWRTAMKLAEAVYCATRAFPDEERYGLSSQTRRAAIAIPSLIAEGYGRASRQDYVRYLRMARGSACEIETQVLLGRRFRYLTADAVATLDDLIGQVGRLLNGLLRSLDDAEKPSDR